MKKILVLLLLLFCFALCTTGFSQTIAPPTDTLSCEQYAVWMAQYYKQSLTLSDWQYAETYKIILKEKERVNAQIAENPEHKAKLMKRFYSILDNKLAIVLTSEQYGAYKDMNSTPMRTVELK